LNFELLPLLFMAQTLKVAEERKRARGVAMWHIAFLFVAFIQSVSGLTSVATGYATTCALNEEAVGCWGWGYYGQNGIGSTEDLLEPPNTAIDLGEGFIPKEVVCGLSQCCAVSASNTSKCWGDNSYGQLGYSDADKFGDEAGEMGDALDVIDWGTDFQLVSLHCGDRFTCALSASGTIKCVGSNSSGQCGYGHSTNIFTPSNETIELGEGFLVASLDCGGAHSCAVSTAGEVKCWGFNGYGKLGVGDHDARGDDTGEMGDNLEAVDLGSNFAVSSIQCGSSSNCVLSEDNEIKCWGYNSFGTLGLGDTYHRGDDSDEMGDNLEAVDLGAFVPRYLFTTRVNNYVLSASGELKAWGRGRFGANGIGNEDYIGDETGDMGDNLETVDLGTDFSATGLATGRGYYYQCVLGRNNTLKCFGYNPLGQLGLGDTLNRGDSANEMGDYLDFVVLNFSRTTTAPTAEPTGEPTKEPTNEPTTTAPTTEPTGKPTKEPTNDPTTTAPTAPTAPTAEPTGATAQPSMSPTSAPVPSPSGYPSVASGSDASANRTTEDQLRMMTAWVVVLAVLVFCLLVFVLLLCFKMKSLGEDQQTHSETQLADVSTAKTANVVQQTPSEIPTAGATTSP